MKSIYREPMVEEGKHNIILQNRCGNRLTMLFHEGFAELEFVYKPNAYRRKEFAARNFSNRDNQTVLFKEFTYPEIKAEYITGFNYDPFVTETSIELPNGGRNTLTFLNVVDENCFALAALSPLALAFKPHGEFKIEDGLLTEKFTDRGEEIVSFVKFNSFVENRFRVLDDGTHILQICENEVILVGGEENAYQVNRLIKKLSGKTLEELKKYNEQNIKMFTGKSVLKVNNPDFQRVLDLNRRIVYSEVDEGGVTFGALQRIYFLNWFRDTLMATAMFALTGNPFLLKLSYPYCFNNPSVRKMRSGKELREYLQLIGTRWTKSEDDGIFYILYGLYNLYKTTGDDEYLWERNLEPIMTAVDFAIETLFDEKKGIFGSDTVGETTLKSSIFYGYDAVNGSIDKYVCPNQSRKGKSVVYCYSLYQNVNMYNVLRMLEVLIKASPDVDQAQAVKYRDLADRLQASIVSTFANDKGRYNPGFFVLEDGEELWIDDFRKLDLWEYTWAVSLAPFMPDIPLALESGRYVMREWPTEKTYGYCPWNTLSRVMREYGISDAEYEKMLSQEIQEALDYMEKYPMDGAFTEYSGKRATQWRGLPFSAGSFMISIYSLILQSLPLGLAVRASGFVDKVNNFVYKDCRINAASHGKGEQVGSWSVNGVKVEGSLQIPEGLLRTGNNTIEIERVETFDHVRLYSSSGLLQDVKSENGRHVYTLYCPTCGELVFENFDKAKSLKILCGGNEVHYESKVLEGTNKTVVSFNSGEDVKVVVEA